MNISQQYEKEFLAFRYGVMCQSSDVRVKAEGYKKLIELCKKLKWIYLQDDLIRTARGESAVSTLIGNTILDSVVEPIQLQQLEDIDSFFIKLNPKDAYNQSHKIREYATSYFSKGNFSQYNNIFSRYIKNMKDLSDSEMNDFIIKFFVASVIKRNYELAITDISSLKQQYIQYDLNIYIFLLRLINGNFSEAADTILNINQNINEDVWKIVGEVDLTFYFTLALLVCFKRNVLKEIQILSHSMVYRFFEDSVQNLELLENYAKCRYEWISEQFELIQAKVAVDPLLANNYSKINFEVKNNIMKEILNSSSSVSIDYLAKVLREKDTIKVENWILSGISDGYLKVRIDDVEKTIYSQETNSMAASVAKTLEFTKRTYNNSVQKIGNAVVANIQGVETKDLDLDELKKYPIEKSRGQGRGLDENDGFGH